MLEHPKHPPFLFCITYMVYPGIPTYRVYRHYDSTSYTVSIGTPTRILLGLPTYKVYRISSKSRRGEILFQGSVWCGDNSRAARFRGRRLQRSIRTHVHSFNNKPSCMHVKCACAYGNCCRPLTMRRDFEGGVYWDELADRCGEISRAAGFRGAARFRGNTVAMLT